MMLDNIVSFHNPGGLHFTNPSGEGVPFAMGCLSIAGVGFGPGTVQTVHSAVPGEGNE